MSISFKVLRTAFFLFISSWILFLLFIQLPQQKHMEELHYIPSAKQILALERNQNYEHPPLAKEIMSVSIAIWGDHALGWRFMSTFFGAITLLGVYFFALYLFKNSEAALWTSLLTLCNHLLYVQSRIAMLDTFMMAFLIWAMLFFLIVFQENDKRKRFALCCGIFFGLASACKWFALVPTFICSAMVLWKELKSTKPNLIDWILYFCLVPFIVYYLSYLPFFLNPRSGVGMWDFWSAQVLMWNAQQHVTQKHNYMSEWYQWPLMNRPYWHAFYTEGANREWTRGVVLLGNPLIMWSGLLAIFHCAWVCLKKKSSMAFWPLFFYAMYLGAWIFIPRKICFYYYYYPAGMVLSFALAYCFYFTKLSPWRWLFLLWAAGVFIYFFPILSGMKIPLGVFRQWMWFRSWI